MGWLDFKRNMVVFGRSGNPDGIHLQTVGIPKAVADRTVPNIVGMTYPNAQAALTAVGLSMDANIQQPSGVTNLLSWTEEFDKAYYFKGNVTVIPNAITAPDGTLTADLLLDTSSTSTHYLEAVVAGLASVSVNITRSAFVKAYPGSNAVFFIETFSKPTTSISAKVFFNPTTGVFSSPSETGGASHSYYAIAYPDGWWRVVHVVNLVGSADTEFYAHLNLVSGLSGSYPGTGTNGLYISSAQVEVGSQATLYIPSQQTFTSRASSATYINNLGLIATAATNVARMNYTATDISLAPKLLLEAAATNLLIRSEEFDNVAWSKDNVAITPNATTAPDGTLTAELSTTTLAGSVNTGWLQELATVAVDTTIRTYSAYVKQGGSPAVMMNIAYAGGTFVQAKGTFTWATEAYVVVGGLGGTVTKLNNGWYRLTLTLANNNSAGSTTCTSRVYNRDDGTSNTLTDSIYLWGAQLEPSAFASSYIPTTSAAVTRAADIATSASAPQPVVLTQSPAAGAVVPKTYSVVANFAIVLSAAFSNGFQQIGFF
jgi:hypothetical protein